MTSIAKEMQRYISASPSVKECLRRGLINHSALAREVCRGRKSWSVDAALMAVGRQARRMKTQPSSEREIRTAIQRARLFVRSKMLLAAIHRQREHRKLLSFQAQIKERGDDVTVIEGHEVLTLITGAEHASLVRTTFRGSVRHLIEDLAQIMLILSPKAMFIPGFSAFILTQIAEQGVNVLEEVTCSGEHLILVREEDLTKSLQALHLNV